MRWLLFFIIIVALFAILYRAFLSQDQNISDTLKIKEATLNVKVADSENERVQGLSGKTGLEEKEGLLFVFETEGYHGIWMKDMNFPIDIAWLDKNKKIIHIEHNVSPETYPKVFNPPTPDKFVLETKAGFFQKFDIKIGDIAYQY